MAAIAGQQLITLLGSDTRRGFSASVRSAQLGHALLEKPLIRTAFRFQSEIEPVVRQQFKVLQEQRQAMLNTAKEELRLNEDGWAELQAIKSRLADFNRYFDEVEVDTAAAFQELHGMYVQLYHDRLTASKPPTQQVSEQPPTTHIQPGPRRLYCRLMSSRHMRRGTKRGGVRRTAPEGKTRASPCRSPTQRGGEWPSTADDG